MPVLEQLAIERVLLNGATHTYGSLRAFFDVTFDDGGSMQIDRTIQKLRKKKLIKMKRQGRQCLWTAVPQKAEA